MEHSRYADMAATLGIAPALLYPVKTVARVLGVETSTVYDEIAAGRMRYHLPEGRTKGKLIAPDWVDEWVDAGVH